MLTLVCALNPTFHAATLRAGGAMSIVAATLLASPAFAGPLITQSTQVESIDTERVITEAVVNGRLTDAALDAAPANELRLVPNWFDEDLDPLRQRTCPVA